MVSQSILNMTTQADTSAPDRFLKLLRKALAGSGLSLNEAARQSDISPAYFSRLINGIRGVPGDETISKLEAVLDIQPRGLLFDAAGRHDVILAKVVKKDSERVLMRALAPLTNEDFAKVVKVAEQLAKKYNAQ
jgi:transcriptional regulator with XRE-family HTH domain